jgi:hypothetical protein
VTGRTCRTSITLCQSATLSTITFHIVLGVTHYTPMFNTVMLVIITLLPAKYFQNSLENKKFVIVGLSGIGPDKCIMKNQRSQTQQKNVFFRKPIIVDS